MTAYSNTAPAGAGFNLSLLGAFFALAPTSFNGGVRLGAASFAIAGVLFLLYPAIRPFSGSSTITGSHWRGATL